MKSEGNDESEGRAGQAEVGSTHSLSKKQACHAHRDGINPAES